MERPEECTLEILPLKGPCQATEMTRWAKALVTNLKTSVWPLRPTWWRGLTLTSCPSSFPACYISCPPHHTESKRESHMAPEMTNCHSCADSVGLKWKSSLQCDRVTEGGLPSSYGSCVQSHTRGLVTRKDITRLPRGAFPAHLPPSGRHMVAPRQQP